MGAIFRHELKLNFKSLMIWSLSVGIMGFACVMMYTSMEGEMADMADTFSNLGAFSDAFGLTTLSIATIGGFFATEVGAVHGLGSAMFAALMATVLLSKEEDAHTGEFLYSAAPLADDQGKERWHLQLIRPQNYFYGDGSDIFGNQFEDFIKVEKGEL